MPNINLDDAYILDETGAQVDKVTGLFTKDEDTTSGEKAFAQLNIGTAGSNRNLLDNPFFQVNQLETTTISANNSYIADRWLCSGNNWAATNDGSGVTMQVSGGVAYLFQKLPSDVYDVLDGKTVTYSILADGEIHAVTFVWDKTKRNTNVLFPDQTILQFWYGDQGQPCLRFTAANTYVVSAIKLELGSVSTLANDAPPNYAEELEKCKYYCRVVDFDTDVSVGIGWAFSNSGAVIPNIFGFGNEMRAVPTVTSTGSFVLRTTSGSNINVTSFAIGASVKDAISLNASVASGLTANQPVRLQAGTGAKLVFSANL